MSSAGGIFSAGIAFQSRRCRSGLMRQGRCPQRAGCSSAFPQQAQFFPRYHCETIVATRHASGASATRRTQAKPHSTPWCSREQSRTITAGWRKTALPAMRQVARSMAANWPLSGQATSRLPRNLQYARAERHKTPPATPRPVNAVAMPTAELTESSLAPSRAGSTPGSRDPQSPAFGPAARAGDRSRLPQTEWKCPGACRARA